MIIVTNSRIVGTKIQKLIITQNDNDNTHSRKINHDNKIVNDCKLIFVY